MATNETVAQETFSSLQEEVEHRRRCYAAEREAIRLGSLDDSLAAALRRIVCVGQYVSRAEGGDLQPERAMLKWAAMTTKALAIAISRSEPGGNDEHDLVLYDHEAAVVLGGLSEMLAAAPRLMDVFQDVELKSPRHTSKDDDGNEEGSAS